MMDIRTYYLAAACCILPLSPFAPALADADEPPEEGGERCIDTRRISNTQIIDKQNILFHMRDRTIYHNELPRSCPGLRRGKTISYRTSISRLCGNDFITLLDSYGMGMSRGASCGLGKFRPISLLYASLSVRSIFLIRSDFATHLIKHSARPDERIGVAFQFWQKGAADNGPLTRPSIAIRTRNSK